MSEISMYEAQKKRMQGLCDEHELVFRFRKDQYPVSFTISPISGVEGQMSMLENTEEAGYRSPGAKMTWYFIDGVLETKVTGGTFTIGKTLRTKIETVLVKMITFWQQYFFRDIMEKGSLKPGMEPVIDEDEADDSYLTDGEDDPEYEGKLEDDMDEFEEDECEPELDDPLIREATALVRAENKATVSLLQRRLNIGAFAAATLLDQLEDCGVVGPDNGDGPREVLPADEPEE